VALCMYLLVFVRGHSLGKHRDLKVIGRENPKKIPGAVLLTLKDMCVCVCVFFVCVCVCVLPYYKHTMLGYLGMETMENSPMYNDRIVQHIRMNHQVCIYA